MPNIDKQTGVRDIESTFRLAQKTGENMDSVIRQEFLAITPADRQAALAQLKIDRAADPSLPGLEITDRGGDVSVKSDTTRSWTSWGKDVLNDVEANFRRNVSTGNQDTDQFKHAWTDPYNDTRKKIPGQQ